MRSFTLILAFLTSVTVVAVADAKEKQSVDLPLPLKDQTDYTQLQIFLDNANFSPGKINGRGNDFTKKALALYRLAHCQPASRPAARLSIDVSGIDLGSVDPVFIEYEVTQEDIANAGISPKEPLAQAKSKGLPYASLVEAIAEKFHTDIDYLRELNPGKTDHTKAGDKLKVPNVKPFELAEVKAESKATDAIERGASTPDASASKDIAIRVSKEENMLELRVGDKVAAAFPVTVGSQQALSPVGSWKVSGVAKMPNFRSDTTLHKGKRSSHLLPPGPNNPVGVVWIALNEKGVGIHGTSEPDDIGQASSEGSIRLANWDAMKLAVLIKTGVTVTIE